MAKRPNIVIFLSDQQRWDTLGNAGVWQGVTPNLDRLGERGAVFSNCYSTQPVCGPARACIQSGRYASETGNFINGKTLPPDDTLMAQKLKAAGYDTAYIGKWHIYKDPTAFDKALRYDVPKKYRAGYDYWRASNLLEFSSSPYGGHIYGSCNEKLPITGYRVDSVTDYAIEYLEQRSGDRPFLLFISQLEPHHQNDLRRFVGPDGEREKYKDCAVPADLEGLDGNYESELPDYLAMCESLDKNVGRLVERLEEKGLWDNTLFIYSADHGCHFMTRNGEYKRSCHDASIRVPMVVCGKGFENTGLCTDMVSILDIAPTALYAAGVELPKCYRGVPMQLHGGRSSSFVQISELQCGRAVRTERYTYSVINNRAENAMGRAGADEYYEDCLYDNENDPAQRVNLIDDVRYDEAKSELRKILADYIKAIECASPRILPRSQNELYSRKYSMCKTLGELRGDERVLPLLEKWLPMLLHPANGHSPADRLPLDFTLSYLARRPGMQRRINAFEHELERLN